MSSCCGICSIVGTDMRGTRTTQMPPCGHFCCLSERVKAGEQQRKRRRPVVGVDQISRMIYTRSRNRGIWCTLKREGIWVSPEKDALRVVLTRSIDENHENDKEVCTSMTTRVTYNSNCCEICLVEQELWIVW